MIRITAESAGAVLCGLHESLGMSRRAFARQLAESTYRSPDSCNEQLFEWCRPANPNGRYPNIVSYEIALRELGFQLAVVPIEEDES